MAVEEDAPAAGGLTQRRGVADNTLDMMSEGRDVDVEQDVAAHTGEVPCRRCGAFFRPKRTTQLYCSPDHRPPPRTLRLSDAQALVLLQIADQLR